MRNQTCSICGKSFPPRAGKLYCSSTCKQIAFSERKRNGSQAHSPALTTLPAVTHRYVFNIAEFKAIKKHLYAPIELEDYYFLRRNYKIAFNAEIIATLIKKALETLDNMQPAQIDRIRIAISLFQVQLMDGSIQFIDADFSHIPECYRINGRQLDSEQSNRIETVTNESIPHPFDDSSFTDLLPNQTADASSNEELDEESYL